MGIGHRFFIVDERDNIIKLPFTKYEKLFEKGSGESLPQYKNTRVRYVYVSLNTKNRKPVSICRIEYCYVHLDEKGIVDWGIFNSGLAEAMECIEKELTTQKKERDENIIDATHIFKRKQMEHKKFWKPSKEIEKQILKEIFS